VALAVAGCCPEKAVLAVAGFCPEKAVLAVAGYCPEKVALVVAGYCPEKAALGASVVFVRGRTGMAESAHLHEFALCHSRQLEPR
jgi:hypothetical protein